MGDVTVKLNWTGGLAFSAVNSTGIETVMDGNRQAGASPVEILMEALGFPVSIAGVADYYHDFLDVLVADSQDSALAEELVKSGTRVHCMPTMLRTQENRVAVAQEVLGLALRPPAEQAAVERA